MTLSLVLATIVAFLIGTVVGAFLHAKWSDYVITQTVGRRLW